MHAATTSARPISVDERGGDAPCGALEAASRAHRVAALRSASEIEAIRRAGAIVADALDAARRACVVGATSRDIDRAARLVIEQAGAEPLFLGYRGSSSRSSTGAARTPFPAATCVSINEQLVHGVPSSRLVGAGDLVSIDCGVRLDGWCADAAITVPVGPVGSDRLALIECAQTMLAHALRAAIPGRRWSSIAFELEEIADRAGFAIAADFVGHGIGRELHEAPQVPCSVTQAFLDHHDFTLRPGMVLAIEPMLVLEAPRRAPHERTGLPTCVNPLCSLGQDGWTVTVDSGAVSCHVEHTVVVTRSGTEVLTRAAAKVGADSSDGARGVALLAG
ncbi:MAG: type I methionyl aminopeptidase [Phycisphaera sp.]|nr:type I methionyl aminopeptidase [Phycisphaera sp.]